MRHSVVDHRLTRQVVEQDPGNQLMDHPTCQIRLNGPIEHIACTVCRLDTLFDLRDPSRRPSLDGQSGKLALVHQAAKNKAEK